MTTNHRPTLESKRGKKRPISDTIVHAKGLNQQGLLKYRSDLKHYDVSAEQARQLNDEINLKDKAKRVEKVTERVTDTETEVPHNDATGVKTGEKSEGPSSVHSGTEEAALDPKEEANSKASDVDSELDSDSDSDSDTEALLAELNKIKQEKELQKQQEKQKLLNSNPLLTEEPKKGWRSSAFRSKKKPKKDEQFTTNTVESEYHQLFMKKFIR